MERWIRARPKASRRREATILASRAALRVWPLLASGLARMGERQFAELTLAGFLAEHFAWFAPIAKLLMKAFAG